jgi:hypothetical protein
MYGFNYKLLFLIVCVKTHNHILLWHVTSRWWGGNKMEGVSFHHVYLIYMHYEKSFPLKPHYLVTRALKQLIYNYITIRV